MNNNHTMNDNHPANDNSPKVNWLGREALLVVPPRPERGETEPWTMTVRVPYCGLLEAIVFLLAGIAFVLDMYCASVLMNSTLATLQDPDIALVSQVNREIERDPSTAEAYRRIGFLLERSTDQAGTPHWKVSCYVPTAAIK